MPPLDDTCCKVTLQRETDTGKGAMGHILHLTEACGVLFSMYHFIIPDDYSCNLRAIICHHLNNLFNAF